MTPKGKKQKTSAIIRDRLHFGEIISAEKERWKLLLFVNDNR